MIALLVADMHRWSPDYIHPCQRLPSHPPEYGHQFTASADLWDAAVDDPSIPPKDTCLISTFLESPCRESRGCINKVYRHVLGTWICSAGHSGSDEILRLVWHTTSVVALTGNAGQWEF
jgi:hypothetical protein